MASPNRSRSPGGYSAASTRDTSAYTYYAATDQPAAPVCAAGITISSVAQQRGLLKTSQDLNPAAGESAGIVREQLNDDAGRVIASHAGNESPWSCTEYDSRGRVSKKSFPSGGGQLERTVTYNYSVGGDPMLSSVSDGSGNFDLRTRVDLLGRTTDTQDAWGTITHTDYDPAGRPVQSTVFSASGSLIERTMSDYATTGTGVNQLSAVRWFPKGGSIPAYTPPTPPNPRTNYDFTALLGYSPMPTITGTTLAGMTFDALGRPEKTNYDSGVQTVAGFDTYQRPSNLTSTKTAAPAALVTSDSVTRDVSGRVIDESVDGADANPSGPNYGYDKAGRLNDWYVRDPSSTNVSHGTYSFGGYTGTPCSSAPGFELLAGKNSNRLESSVQVNGVGPWATTSYCYDRADRLQAVNPPSGSPNPYSAVRYDAHGNTTQIGGQALLYDGADRHIGDTNPVTPTALLVVGAPASLTNRDAWMKQRLIDDGWTVTVADDDGITASAATGKQLIVVTDSVAGSTVGTTFKSVAVPIVDSEAFIYDDLGMTGPQSSTDYGSTGADQTQLTVTAAGAASPLGAGLQPGANPVSSTSVTTGWGKPNAAATVVATVPGAANKAAIFAYDTGAAMVSGSAPARRVGWWHYESSTNGYTSSAAALFDAAVAWAAGTTPKIDYTRDATDRIIQRSVNSHVEEKYSYSATGDTSDLTLDPSGAATEATLTLPGGAIYTWRSAAPVWSYPNLHGDIAATTDAAGTKIGVTQAYDPYGATLTAATSGELDNSAGQLDYGWEGKAQRPLEHQSGTVPIVEMGARPYDPSTGRFLSVDPVEGGTPNDYVYPTDPVNQNDLTGLCGFGNPWKKCDKHHRGPASFWGGAGAFVAKHRHGLTEILALTGAVACTAASLGALGGVCGAAAAATWLAAEGTAYADDIHGRKHPKVMQFAKQRLRTRPSPWSR